MTEPFIANDAAVEAAAKALRVKRPKQLSRPARWAIAIEAAEQKLGAMQNAALELVAAMEALAEIRSEYEDWRSNLPENLEGSALAEKLDAVIELELSWEETGDIGEAESMIEAARDVELPRGFGRD